MPGPQVQRSLGRVLYRQPPDSGVARVAIVSIILSIPWLLLPLFQPNPATYITAVFGVSVSGIIAIGLEACLRRQEDAIHERGARLTVDGEPTIVWFTDDTFVSEVHEFLRDYGASNANQWVFELRSGDRIATLATDAPRTAERIRAALTLAMGQPPAQPRPK